MKIKNKILITLSIFVLVLACVFIPFLSHSSSVSAEEQTYTYNMTLTLNKGYFNGKWDKSFEKSKVNTNTQYVFLGFKIKDLEKGTYKSLFTMTPLTQCIFRTMITTSYHNIYCSNNNSTMYYIQMYFAGSLTYDFSYTTTSRSIQVTGIDMYLSADQTPVIPSGYAIIQNHFALLHYNYDVPYSVKCNDYDYTLNSSNKTPTIYYDGPITYYNATFYDKGSIKKTLAIEENTFITENITGINENNLEFIGWSLTPQDSTKNNYYLGAFDTYSSNGDGTNTITYQTINISSNDILDTMFLVDWDNNYKRLLFKKPSCVPDISVTTGYFTINNNLYIRDNPYRAGTPNYTIGVEESGIVIKMLDLSLEEAKDFLKENPFVISYKVADSYVTTKQYVDDDSAVLLSYNNLITCLDNYKVTTDIDFYACYSPVSQYVVNFYDDDNNVFETQYIYEHNPVIEPSSLPQKIGHTFLSWDYNFNLSNYVNCNLDIYPIFSVNQYTIYIMYNDEVYRAYTADYGSVYMLNNISTPVEEGYHFSNFILDDQEYLENYISIADKDLYLYMCYLPNEYDIRIYDYYNGLYYDDVITYDTNIFSYLNDNGYLRYDFYNNEFVLNQRIYLYENGGYFPLATLYKNEEDIIYSKLCVGETIIYVEYDIRANISYKLDNEEFYHTTHDFLEYDYRWFLNKIHVPALEQHISYKNDIILSSYFMVGKNICIDNIFLNNDKNIYDVSNRLLRIDLSTFLDIYWYDFTFDITFDFYTHYEDILYSITWFYPNAQGGQEDRCVVQDNLKYNTLLIEPFIDFVELDLMFVRWDRIVRNGEQFDVIDDSGILPTLVQDNYLFRAVYYVDNNTGIDIEEQDIYEMLKLPIWVDDNSYEDVDGNQIANWLKPFTNFLSNLIMVIPRVFYNVALWLVFKAPVISDLINFITGGLLKVFVLDFGYIQQLSAILYIGPLLLSLLLLLLAYRLIF